MPLPASERRRLLRKRQPGIVPLVGRSVQRRQGLGQTNNRAIEVCQKGGRFGLQRETGGGRGELGGSRYRGVPQQITSVLGTAKPIFMMCAMALIRQEAASKNLLFER